ncbi:MAG: cysteine synthase A [Gemmatimonadaceae bacterium]
MRANSILDTVGDTPHVRINRLYASIAPNAEVWLKLERANPGGSIKDRIGVAMIDDAERRGILKKGSVIVEPTSGNTGIGLAMAAAVKGYRCILTMPDSMSVERRRVLAAYGAELELTPREKGIKGSIARAEEIVAATPNAWMPQQFENPANLEIHRKTTAREILNDFPDGLDYLITGVGTGGHITGVSEVLKKTWKGFKTFAVEPEKSQVLSGGTHSPHKLQGIGAGFVPKNFHADVVDGYIQVTEDDAFEHARRAAKEEGIFVGPSSGAVLAAVAKKLPELPEKSRVIAFCYDTGERYLSVEGLFL